MRSAISTQAHSRHCLDGLPWGVTILWKLELVGIPSLRRSYASEYCASRCRIGTTGLRFGDLFLKSADGLAIVAGRDRRNGRLERTGFLNAPCLHVFEKLGSDFGLFNESKNCPALRFVYCSAVSVVIIPDHHDIADVAGNVAPQVGIGAPHRLHVGLAARGVRRR